MKRWIALFAALALTLFLACSSDYTNEVAGLQVIIASDLATPGDLDEVRIEERRQTAPGQWGAPALKELRIPADVVLPLSYAILAGNGDDNVQLRVVGKKSGAPVVLRVIETRLPRDHVRTLEVILARSCAGQVVVDGSSARATCSSVLEACRPETGTCGPPFVDSTTLPEYRPGDENRIVFPRTDAGAGDATPPAMAVDASDAATPASTPDATPDASSDGSADASPDAASEAGAPSSTKDISSFSILGIVGTIAGSSITVTLPAGTIVGTLVPTIAITGVSVSPASGVAMSFSSPVTYSVTAEDGSKKAYVVTVNVAVSNTKDITSFVINGVSATIAGQNIAVTLPFGTDLTNLTPLVQINGASVSPASGATRSFATPQTYVVTAGDSSTKVYTVTVTLAASSQKDITRISINGADGIVSGTEIKVPLPAGTNVTALTPTITISGQTISPPSGMVQDFTNPVAYTVTAADLSTKTYLVSVNVTSSAAKDITSFAINGVNGTISGSNQIVVTLPSGTDRSILTPLITHTGQSISPPSGATQNFNSVVIYTVTASDLTTKQYSVSVALQ